MNVQPGTKKPFVGVSGHVGAGHVHSHSGFIQDDSAGFAAAASLIGMAYPVETTIRRVTVAADTVEIFTAGGLGPVEDLEGNLSLAEKGRLMDRIGLSGLPTIILESKAYVPAVSDTMEKDVFWVRYNREFDNPAVGKALIRALEQCGLPLLQSDAAYPRHTGEMRDNAASLGRRIVAMGRRIEKAGSAAEKVRLIGELAILVSQDAGGMTYMTDAVHEIAAGGGLVPGTAAVLSMAVSRATIERCLVPDFTRTDAMHYLTVTGLSIKILSENLEEAASFLERQNRFARDALERLMHEKQRS